MTLLHTSYSEASYFEGYAFQHIAAREEHLRMKRIEADNRKAYAQFERRRNSRLLRCA